MGALSDEELTARVGAPVELAPALRGARDLNEARDYAASILEPEPVTLGEEARPPSSGSLSSPGASRGRRSAS